MIFVTLTSCLETCGDEISDPNCLYSFNLLLWKRVVQTGYTQPGVCSTVQKRLSVGAFKKAGRCLLIASLSYQ